MNQKEKQKIKLPLIRLGLEKDREFFSENLSVLVSSGMSILEALDSISEDVRTRAMKKIISYVRNSVYNGRPLWKSLDEVKIFQDHYISLIRIGEETGRLSQNLKVVAVQEQKNSNFTSKIKSAMTYPVFVMVLILIVSVLIAWFILPRLATVFSQLDVELPLITKILIDVGIFLQAYGYIVIPAIVILIGLFIYLLFFNKKFKFIGQYLLFKTPGIGRLIREVEIARFSFLLGTLIESGVPVTEALDSVSRATSFRFYRNIYSSVRESVVVGNSIEHSFKKIEDLKTYIPTPVQQMIFSAEKSGNLSVTLKKISEMYETRTDDTTKNLTVILEPVLLVIVWVGVVGVALAVILPIYSLIGGFQIN